MNEPERTKSSFEIGLSAWIIQDGNYGDFHVGDQAEFAVEFYPDTMNRANSSSPALLERTGPAQYTARGRVLHLTSEVCVLDLGFLAFRESKPPKGLSVGDSVFGTLSLGIDPFFYFERLYADSSIPPLIYTWRLHQILMETAPFIKSPKKTAAGDKGYLRRDPTKRARRSIIETKAWEDDGGDGDYVLICELLDIPPKRNSVTAFAP